MQPLLCYDVDACGPTRQTMLLPVTCLFFVCIERIRWLVASCRAIRVFATYPTRALFIWPAWPSRSWCLSLLFYRANLLLEHVVRPRLQPSWPAIGLLSHHLPVARFHDPLANTAFYQYMQMVKTEWKKKTITGSSSKYPSAPPTPGSASRQRHGTPQSINSFPAGLFPLAAPRPLLCW